MDKFVYTFSVWPDEGSGFPKSVFTVFDSMKTRIELELSAGEFQIFRDELSAHGLQLHEIERRQAVPLESVL